MKGERFLTSRVYGLVICFVKQFMVLKNVKMTLSSVIREDPCEFLGAITSFVTFLSDLITDLTVAGFYFYYGHLNWGLLTLLLIFVPGK